MAKTLIASKLINKVVAQVDRSSFKKAKQEIYKLKKMMDKISSPIRVAKAQMQQQKQVIQGIRQESKERQKMYSKIKQSTDKIKGGVNLDRPASTKGKDYTDWWKHTLKEQTRYQRMFDRGELKIVNAKRSSDDLIAKTNEKTLEKLKVTRKSIEDVVSKPYKIRQPTDKLKGGVGIEFGKGHSKDYTKRNMYASLFKQQDDFAKNAAKVRQEIEKNLGKPFEPVQPTDKLKGGVNLDPINQKKVIDKNYENWWSTELKKQSDYTKLFDQAEKRKSISDRQLHQNRVKQETVEYKQKVRNAIKLRKELNKQRRARAADQFRRQTLAGVGTERFDYELSSRAMKFSPREISGYQKRLSQLNNQLRLNTISSETYRTRLNHLNSDMRKHSTQVKSLSERYGKLRSAIVAGTAAFSGYAGVMSIAQASSAQQQIESMMRAVFFDEAPNQLAFLRKEAMRLGVSFEESAKPFARFAFAAKAAGLSTEEANKQFSGIAELSVIFGNTVDETSGILKALEQMYSKTKVQAEELNF